MSNEKTLIEEGQQDEAKKRGPNITIKADVETQEQFERMVAESGLTKKEYLEWLVGQAQVLSLKSNRVNYAKEIDVIEAIIDQIRKNYKNIIEHADGQDKRHIEKIAELAEDRNRIIDMLNSKIKNLEDQNKIAETEAKTNSEELKKALKRVSELEENQNLQDDLKNVLKNSLEALRNTNRELTDEVTSLKKQIEKSETEKNQIKDNFSKSLEKIADLEKRFEIKSNEVEIKTKEIERVAQAEAKVQIAELKTEMTTRHAEAINKIQEDHREEVRSLNAHIRDLQAQLAAAKEKRS